ncbi:hypothetical protein [Flavobacterium sp. 14A]|uniref:hypothetical protein n=1 Tax=Flavobacterium sp. 14A TaxID=2735896 RepID=UPI00156F06C1|nr:hypothetical protein [Flavobacterium sp. 14A]NRT11516.1 hypothetical protein [Flavobacterium sp. 14A]
MIDATFTDNYKNVTKVTILDAKKVFYPLNYVLQKRNIIYDDDLAIEVSLLPENIKYPSSSKITDAGLIRAYKITFDINGQSPEHEAKLESYQNKKVIIVLHYTGGRMIFGCNEMPLDYSFDDENTADPQSYSGFSITCSGNSYYLKVSL